MSDDRRFPDLLLETVGGMDPALAEEIAAVIDNPEDRERWLRDHGFGRECHINQPHDATECDGYHLDLSDT